MRRAAVVTVVILGLVGVAEAGEKKLPKSVSLVERQPKDVEPHPAILLEEER